MPLQSVLFPKNYTMKEVKQFVTKHNLKPIKDIHETARFKRLRISEPNYNKYSTKKLSNGIELVIGYP